MDLHWQFFGEIQRAALAGRRDEHALVLSEATLLSRLAPSPTVRKAPLPTPKAPLSGFGFGSGSFCQLWVLPHCLDCTVLIAVDAQHLFIWLCATCGVFLVGAVQAFVHFSTGLSC